MKNKIILLLFGLFAFVADVVAADTSRYVEFARTYGIVRYFSPNPYTQDWSESDWMKVCALLADRAETQSLETLFKPLAPTMSLTAVPVSSSGENDTCSGGRAMYYSYSGSGELNVPFLAKLLMPGLADYIPYYKNSQRFPAALIRQSCLWHADITLILLAKENILTYSMRCPKTSLTVRQHAVCLQTQRTIGRIIRLTIRLCQKEGDSFSDCCRTRR